jgi:hypothetical protein
MDPKAQADALLARMAKTYKMAGDSEDLRDAAIGRTVRMLLAAGAKVDIDVLTAELEREVNSCPSSRGKGAAELDVKRIILEAAISVIRSLRKPDPA